MQALGTKVHFATSRTEVACGTRGRLTCTTTRLAFQLRNRGTCLHCANVVAEQDRQRCIAAYRELGMIGGVA